MAQEFTTYGFTAGEVAPKFESRSDLVKYGLGVSIGENVFSNVEGPLTSRPGSEMINRVLSDTEEHKLARFKATGDDFLLVFSDMALRFVRSGGFVLDSAKAVAISDITLGATTVIETASNTFDAADWLFLDNIVGPTELNGKFYTLSIINATSFTLKDLDGNDVDTTGLAAYVSGGTVWSVYTIATPYAAADLPALKFEQRFNDMFITHITYPRQKLHVVTDDSWTLTAVGSGPSITFPPAISGTANPVGNYGTIYSVSAVGADGSESLPSAPLYASIVDFNTVAGNFQVAWTAVSGAAYYLVYRTLIVSDDDDITLSMEMGFIGTATGTSFVDNNIVPDFTKNPVSEINPFANEAIQTITVTGGGSGYTRSSVVAVTVGSGFIGYPILGTGSDKDTLVGISILSG